MKRSLIFWMGLIFTINSIHAQITINLALASRPQPWLSDWSNPANGYLILTFMPGPVAADPDIKLRTTLTDESGSVIAVSNLATARVYRLKEGVNQFSAADALQLQNLRLNGKAQQLLQRSGRLAAGNYQLMVEVFNASGDAIRAKQSRSFFVTAYRLPTLMAPVNGALLDATIAQNAIIFRWTSLVPGTPELPVYQLQVFEILPGQTSMQAFRGNRPILNETISRGLTQYVWRPALAMLDSTANKHFIWTVQTLDRDGMPVPSMDVSTQGRSEPFTFSIINKEGLVKRNAN